MLTSDTLPPLGAHPADALAALKAQLAAQAQDNPGIALLLQLMEQQRPLAEAKVPDAELEVDETSLESVMRADLQTLLDSSAQLGVEIEGLQRRNDALAAALGACHLCFGEDGWCRLCGGRGRPGSRRPDADAFNRYVRPTLLRLQRPVPAGRDAPRSDTALGGAARASPDSAEGLRAGAVWACSGPTQCSNASIPRPTT